MKYVQKCGKILLVILGVSIVLLAIFRQPGSKKNIGIAAITDLYQFRSVDDIQFQLNNLKRITTKEVFNQLTIDNEERRLNTYLKFEEASSLVKIQKATSSYVIYSLECDSIDSDRDFVFFFDVNNSGRISKVRECELVDFNG